jgi:hypothetical protein
MQITRREDMEQLTLDEVRASFAREERTTAEIHVSDLEVPRKAYWGRLLPRPATDDEIGYFVAGRGHEDVYGRISGLLRGEAREIDGILLRPDFYTTIPTEMKTRRRGLADTAEEAVTKYDTYIERCRNYAALLNRPAAWLMVLGLVQEQADGTTKPAWQWWEMEFTPEELAAALATLHRRRDRLAAAWQDVAQHGRNGQHRALDLCPTWQCGKQSTTFEPWTCEDCQKPGTGPHCTACHRYFVNAWGAERHVTSKTGAGHVTVAGKTKTSFVPRCRWIDACQPWLDDPSRGPSDPEEKPDAGRSPTRGPSDPEGPAAAPARVAPGVRGGGPAVGDAPRGPEPHDPGGVAGEPGADAGGGPGGHPGRAESWDF